MTRAARTRTVAVPLLLAAVLVGCGTDERPGSAPSASTAATAEPTEHTPSTPPGVEVPPTAAASSSSSPRAGQATPPPAAAPSPRGTASTPPFVLPTRSAGAPGARQVVEAFRAAKLPVSGMRDQTADCGPDGAGLGCAELIVTDAVSVYVFPDEASAMNRADMWGTDAHRQGTVILSYLGTDTPAAQRQRYATVLAGLS